MRRTDKVDHVTRWEDVSHAVEQWQAVYGVQIETCLLWGGRMPLGACVEVVIREGNTIGVGQELVRVRDAFPTRKAAGHPGALLWAVSSAVRALENEPWQWSAKMRREAQKNP